MSETDISKKLIEVKNKGNYGLAPRSWTKQLLEIRKLPEVKKTE